MRCVLLMMLTLSGCASFTQSELDLVTQARRGIAGSSVGHDDSVEVMRAARARLDEAFDADARARAELSAEWVIEARKAYGVAVDAFAKRQAAASAAEQMRARNLAAADAALAKLQSLLEIQRKFSFEEIGK